MEPVFEVRTSMTEKLYLEFYRHIWKRIKWFGIVFIVVGVLCTPLYFQERNYMLFLSLYLVVAGIWLCFRPRLAAKRTMRQKREFAGETQQCAITTFADEICDESLRQTITIPYDKIKKLHITQNLIVLIDVRNVAILADKNSFIKGSFQEFLPFIQEKCPQLKLPKW